ncbi:sigma factor-like helix-turn-helix DNA-binding protein, partial [Streptosporangium longisporum]|uniref:sigma factor-like helix-turn-helix DNA-binding protein n=1 Tax=Streptosporangium longisporum TaxID=46187 RepID=UPI003CD08078
MQSPIGEEDSDLAGLHRGRGRGRADGGRRLHHAAGPSSTTSSATLSDREQRIIQLRFGLADGHPRTLEEVGGSRGTGSASGRSSRRPLPQAPPPDQGADAARLSRLRAPPVPVPRQGRRTGVPPGRPAPRRRSSPLGRRLSPLVVARRRGPSASRSSHGPGFRGSGFRRSGLPVGRPSRGSGLSRTNPGPAFLR